MPKSSRDVLSSVSKTPGTNTGEMSESAKASVRITNGASKSAMAYQRAATRHLVNRERRSRSPAFPSKTPVSNTPAMLGPRSIAAIAIGTTTANCALDSGIPAKPTTVRTPPQEMANVRAKYVRIGCFFIHTSTCQVGKCRASPRIESAAVTGLWM
jgi:hypothetical protein